MTSPFCVVDGVSEPRRVYDGEPQSDSFLLNANCVFDDVHCLIDPLCRHTHMQCTSNYIYTGTRLVVYTHAHTLFMFMK